MDEHKITTKEKFFADLDRLDHLDDDEHVVHDNDQSPGTLGTTSTTIKPQMSTITTNAAAVNGHVEIDTQLSRKRKLSPVKSFHKPHFVTAISSPAPLPSVPSSKTLSILSQPTKLRRTESEGPTLTKPGKKNKRKNVEIIAETQRIFNGLTLFWIPNNQNAPVREIRINKAQAYGANWCRNFDNTVTHIIVDSGLHADQASREFCDRKFPTGIPILNDTWVTESIGFKDLRQTTGTRFRVPGLDTTILPDVHNRQESMCDKSSLKRPEVRFENMSNSHQRIHPAHKGGKGIGESMNANDELNDIVKEMQHLGSLPTQKFLDEGVTSFGDDMRYEPSKDDKQSSRQDQNSISRENIGFQCMEKNDGSNENPNARTMELLDQMAHHYDQMGDHWRTTAYRKAIAALRKQSKLISRSEDALKIRGIGARLADKIEEIVTTDRLMRLETTKSSTEDQVLRLFLGVYGVGCALAKRWMAQGYRTLEDLEQKADLTTNQRIGLEHYGDFAQRIPRLEVAKHAEIVEQSLRAADTGLQLIVGGSYRRGNSHSGDIDLVITKEGADMDHIRVLLNDTVIPSLMKQGFLKAALASSNSDEQGSKWHGASTLPDSTIWRRIDLLFVPWAELGAALIYFTGNDIFNRSLRLLARRKAMRLNQHGLYNDVMRGQGGQKLTEGDLLEGHSERRIFEILGVPYRPPEHRKC